MPRLEKKIERYRRLAFPINDRLTIDREVVDGNVDRPDLTAFICDEACADYRLEFKNANRMCHT